MKALSIAALIALGISGAACSQDADANAEDPQPTEAAAETTEAADVGGSFNLGLPTEADSSPANSNGFNLGVPSAGAAATTTTDSFNFATDVSASNGLSDIPEISADIVPAEEEALPEILETREDNEDDEPVIRLE